MIKVFDFDHMRYRTNKTNESELIECLLWNSIVFVKFGVIWVTRLFKKIAIVVSKSGGWPEPE